MNDPQQTRNMPDISLLTQLAAWSVDRGNKGFVADANLFFNLQIIPDGYTKTQKNYKNFTASQSPSKFKPTVISSISSTIKKIFLKLQSIPSLNPK